MNLQQKGNEMKREKNILSITIELNWKLENTI